MAHTKVDVLEARIKGTLKGSLIMLRHIATRSENLEILQNITETFKEVRKLERQIESL